jgi:hypothetical protein
MRLVAVAAIAPARAVLATLSHGSIGLSLPVRISAMTQGIGPAQAGRSAAVVEMRDLKPSSEGKAAMSGRAFVLHPRTRQAAIPTGFYPSFSLL